MTSADTPPPSDPSRRHDDRRWATAPDPRWERFVEREPFFAVIPSQEFRRANLTPAREHEFFNGGDRAVGWMFESIDASLLPGFAPMSALEYGCGIGRLLWPLASRVGSATGVDRSPAMLTLARAEAQRRGATNVDYLTPDELAPSARRYDLVVCYHVLQRLDVDTGLSLLSDLADRIAPNGIGVFHCPVAVRHTAQAALAQRARRTVPGLNAIANRALGKARDEPFIPTYTYNLSDVLALFSHERFQRVQAEFERGETEDHAILFVHKREQPLRGVAAEPWHAPGHSPLRAPSHKDRGREVTRAQIEASNQAAELYFATLTDWEHHLAKPFSQVEETPTLLMSASVTLQNLNLSPGLRVLEFGAGSGWLSHFMAQMGCRTVVMDVAPTALAVSRELFRRRPLIGDQPPPEFLLFDGISIPLPDASVDRVVCFDAFHHALNPERMIQEFGRVLAPGGRAVFAEPGPRHSETARSTFEASTYGVVERDVDIHTIASIAEASGFDRLSLSVYNGLPYHVSLKEFEGLLTGGVEQDAWLASTRGFLRTVRNFSLLKAGDVVSDSRSGEGLACRIEVVPAMADPDDGRLVLEVAVTNTGTVTWLPSGSGRGGVSLGLHLYDREGRLITFDFHWEPLGESAQEVPPGTTVRRRVTLPGLEPGVYQLELDCVASGITWFAQRGSAPVRVTLEI